ncbi:hypothetical protein ACR78F_00100 [Sphingobacterium spiritivorum]|uniref:hypothetical protein n=1 Tax=Sphingobacterium spiritivorum TaxID=258 RepID=UPI003DA5CE2B
MNLYFLVEGKRTESKVYPGWLRLLLPDLVKVNHVEDLNEFNYYLFNGGGYPSLIRTHLGRCIDEINEIGNVDYFVVALDVDETTCEFRVNEILSYIDEQNLELNRAKLIIIPQNRCIETWFLGNKKIYKNNPQNETLVSFCNFYNVRNSDPEDMPAFDDNWLLAQFHLEYLQLMFKERNMSYTKLKPYEVMKEHYLQELIDRAEQTDSLQSFKRFIDFVRELEKEILRLKSA